jgi:hypothetical protein
MICLVIRLFFGFRKPGYTSSRGFDAKRTWRRSHVPAEIGVKLSPVSSLCIRAKLKPAFAFASLPGGQHRFGRILLDSPPRSKDEESVLGWDR